MTLSDHLATANPALAQLLLSVADACVEIAGVVRRGGAEHSAAVSVNVQGEVQKGLDVMANDILIRVAARSPALVAMGSEEMDEIIPVRDAGPDGGYFLLFDPLDGSSNIDVNISVGTIFSILPAPAADPARPATEADLMQPGRNQVAAGYVVYGPQVTLVLTTGDGVAGFTLDPETLVWNRSAERMTVPARTGEYAINASNHRHWAAPVRTYVDELLAGKDGPRGRNFNMRWVGSMVADLHRILTRGGVFLYPWDRREPDRAGRLRLMYEANPMALIIAQAGGQAFDGTTDILDTPVTGLHQRVAVMIGSSEEVDHLKALHAAG
ncbi:MAG: fbp2 [Caulobacter sp.]|nr:fbp2 [Caulobacter sp.]